MDLRRRKRQADVLKISRKLHRSAGALLFVFFFITACTGLLLGWKKQSGGLILPKSHKGISTNANDWLPIHTLQEKAFAVVKQQIDPELSTELDRIDIRPDKGMVKFVFVEDYWGVQLDLTTGELLHIERRRSDLIENIHDGSIIGYFLPAAGEPFKVAYTSILGGALILFTVTGFWLWYGPKRFRAANRRENKEKT